MFKYKFKSTRCEIIFAKTFTTMALISILILNGCSSNLPQTDDGISVPNIEDILNPKGKVKIDGKTYDRAIIKEVCGDFYSLCEPLSDKEIERQFQQFIEKFKILVSLEDAIIDGSQDPLHPFLGGYYIGRPYEVVIIEDVILDKIYQKVTSINYNYLEEVRKYFTKDKDYYSNEEYYSFDSYRAKTLNNIYQQNDIAKLDELISTLTTEEKEDAIRITNLFTYFYIVLANEYGYPLSNYFEEMKEREKK